MKTQIVLGALACVIPYSLGIPLDTSSFSDADIIQRDVAIIGGGSSGTHAAIRLKDRGQSVVVVERDCELGGHVRTFTAASGVRVNYGPSNFQNYTVVRDFFSRFHIPLVPYVQPGSSDVYADFTTGRQVPNGTLPQPDFDAYLKLVSQYPFLGSSWDQIPKPIPQDLLLPFGEFVIKYNLQSVAYTIAQFAIGNGNIFDQPTIYILKTVDADYIRAIVYGEAVAPVTYDTQSLFNMARQELGSNVLLSSTVSQATRSASGVQLVVKTPNGQKLIKAKKLLVTAPPKIETMTPLGLDAKEKGLFSKFQSKAFYVALLNNTGLTTGARYYNVDPNNNSTYHVAKLPGVGFVWATRDVNTFWGWYTSVNPVPESKVRADTIAAFKALGPNSNPKIIAYASATPSAVGVTADEIKNGFYDNLLTLQGYKSTWYTGSAWISDHSAALWNYTEYELLPKLKT